MAFRIYIDYGAKDIDWLDGSDVNTYTALMDGGFNDKEGLARLQSRPSKNKLMIKGGERNSRTVTSITKNSRRTSFINLNN